MKLSLPPKLMVFWNKNVAATGGGHEENEKTG
jgi:hypothetical protein